MFLSYCPRTFAWPRLAVLAGVAAVGVWGAQLPHPEGFRRFGGGSVSKGEGAASCCDTRSGTPRHLEPSPFETAAARPPQDEGSGALHVGADLRRAPFPGPYAATLVRVVDGDTFETRVRVWFGAEVATLVRIRGIDAPELHARCEAERRSAEAARDALARLLTGREIELSAVGPDKYFGRVVADVWVADDEGARDVAAALRAAGFARAYNGRRRADWCATADARLGPIVAQNPQMP